MDRRWIGSWLGGPRAAQQAPEQSLGYPGERLGLPENGPGSAAPLGRRVGAIFVDWLACLLIVRGFLGADQSSTLGSLGVPGLFALEYLVLLPTVGFTVGMRLFGLRVTGLEGRIPSFRATAVRTVLLLLAVPALIWDRDGRGLHDRASGTVVRRR